MLARSLLVALTAAGAATAQVQNYTSPLAMTVDPSQVSAQDRAQWCGAQTNTCSQLCADSASTNDCDAQVLTYKCLCSSNSSAPGLQYYTQTMPTFICLKAFDLCTTQNVGNAKNQEACKTNIMAQCGTLDPAKAVTESSSTTGTASGSSTTNSAQATSQTDSGSASSTSTHKGIAAPTMAAGQGLAAAAAAFGVFAYLV